MHLVFYIIRLLWDNANAYKIIKHLYQFCFPAKLFQDWKEFVKYVISFKAWLDDMFFYNAFLWFQLGKNKVKGQ